MIELIQSVANRLHETFGEEISIYTENQEQGVILPCFFVRLNKSEWIRRFNDFFFLNNQVSIIYMSETQDLFELEKVQFQMLSQLERIELPNAGVTADEISATIQEKNIVVTVQYNIFVEKQKVRHLMKSIDQTGNVKEN